MLAGVLVKLFGLSSNSNDLVLKRLLYRIYIYALLCALQMCLGLLIIRDLYFSLQIYLKCVLINAQHM